MTIIFNARDKFSRRNRGSEDRTSNNRITNPIANRADERGLLQSEIKIIAVAVKIFKVIDGRKGNSYIKLIFENLFLLLIKWH